MRNINYVELNSEQKILLESFIRASLLGDGSIPKLQRNGRNNNMRFGHSEKQLFYLEWKVSFLRQFGLANSITKYVHYSDRYLSGQCTSFFSKSKTHPIFTKYREIYYPEGIKICPDDIFNLDDFGLAIWYMDDGHLWKRKGRTPVYVFNTQGFDNESKKQLQKMLYLNFHIETTILKHHGELRVRVSSMKEMTNRIRPYIFPEFNYKLTERVLNKSDELLEPLLEKRAISSQAKSTLLEGSETT